MTEHPDRSRPLAIALLAGVILAFAAAIVALALGQLVIATACFGLLVAGWFVLRSHQRRRDSG